MEKKTKNAKVSIQKLNLFAVKLKITDFIRLPGDLLSLSIGKRILLLILSQVEPIRLICVPF